MMEIYGFPSQAFWRSFEFDALKAVPFHRPILEVGCSDGKFTSQVCGFVEAAIDINPRALRVAEGSGVFGTVRLQDAGTLEHEEEFNTILVNSVIEHISNPGRVLAGCFRALKPGGQIILTVPLVDMNRHMLFTAPSYVSARQQRLAHVNLLALEQWIALLESAGFAVTRTHRYLAPDQIKLWDAMDVLTMLGTRRINLGTIGYKLRQLLAAAVLKPVYTSVGRVLRSHLGDTGRQNGCAALVLAEKPYVGPVPSSAGNVTPSTQPT